MCPRSQREFRHVASIRILSAFYVLAHNPHEYIVYVGRICVFSIAALRFCFWFYLSLTKTDPGLLYAHIFKHTTEDCLLQGFLRAA